MEERQRTPRTLAATRKTVADTPTKTETQYQDINNNNNAFREAQNRNKHKSVSRGDIVFPK